MLTVVRPITAIPSTHESHALMELDNIAAELAHLRSGRVTLDRAREALIAICAFTERAADAFAAAEAEAEQTGLVLVGGVP